MQLLAWGFTLDAAPGTLGEVELIQSDVASTGGTAHLAAGVQPLTPGQPASMLTLGTGGTGYSFSTLGVPTATRVFDAKHIPVAAGSSDMTYEKIWVPDARPIAAVSSFVQVRVTFGAAVNMSCWIVWNE